MTPERDDLLRRLALIVVTDRGNRSVRALEEIVELALDAGAPAVQLRDKTLPPRAVLPLARRLRTAAHAAGALFFVNDRTDLALAAEADGVHLGSHDLPVAAARRIAPRPFLIGRSARTPADARAAVAAGADYIGCGAVFATRTKTADGDPIGPSGLAAVVQAVEAPVVAIGGVKPADVADLLATGAAGCAVAGAVMRSAEPARAVRQLLATSEAARSPGPTPPRPARSVAAPGAADPQ